MFYAYVIKSISCNYYYKGYCKDLENRLQQHNSGMTISIKPYLPFKIVYFETIPNKRRSNKTRKIF
jgi:putative endonuclease